MKKEYKVFGVDALNIMVIGPSKCGKSAFLSSMKTALEKKFVNIEDSVASTTSNLKQVNDFTLNLQRTIKIFEGIGWKLGNYASLVNYLIESAMGDASEQVDIDGNIIWNKHFHAIIMLYPHFKISNQQEIEMFNEIFVEITSRLCKSYPFSSLTVL